LGRRLFVGHGRLLVVEFLPQQNQRERQAPAREIRDTDWLPEAFFGKDVMDFSISILKDAAVAVDTLVGAISKLGTAILNGTKNTVQLFEFMNAYEARRALFAFNTTVPRLMQTQALLLRPAMYDFTAMPTETTWKDLVREVGKTRRHVDEAVKYMNKSDSLLATQPFFVDLVGALMARTRILNKLEDMRAPKTPDEIEAAKAFFLSYDKLIAELEKTGGDLRSYVDHLQERKIYPPDPPRPLGT
jgi:hypothetical protein